MRVHVIHAHPVETSYNRALFEAACTALAASGHEIDALDLYAEGFEAALSRAERLAYDDVPANAAGPVAPYVARLRAAEALVFVHPVWNFGYPAILKGYFDRVYLPGVSFRMVGGRMAPNLDRIRQVAFIATYGGSRLAAMLMGDPPRRLARRWAWATHGTRTPPAYLALYGVEAAGLARRARFLRQVEGAMSRF